METHKAVYLAPFYVAETGVCNLLKRLQESPSTIRPIHQEKAIEWVQQKLNIELAEKQKEAVLLGGKLKGVDYHRWPGNRQNDHHHRDIKDLSAVEAQNPSCCSHRQGCQEDERSDRLGGKNHPPTA